MCEDLQSACLSVMWKPGIKIRINLYLLSVVFFVFIAGRLHVCGFLSIILIKLKCLLETWKPGKVLKMKILLQLFLVWFK